MSGILKFFQPLSKETARKTQAKQPVKKVQEKAVKSLKELEVTVKKPTKKRGRKRNQEPDEEVEPMDEMQKKEQDKVDASSETLEKEEEEEKPPTTGRDKSEDKQVHVLPSEPQMSSYELKRQQQMAQNAAFLKNLGVKTLGSLKSTEKPKPRPKTKPSLKRPVYTGPVRRSKRVKEAIENEIISAELQVNNQREKEERELKERQEMIEKSFTKSVIYDYDCDHRTSSTKESKAAHSAIDHLPNVDLENDDEPLLTKLYFDDDCPELIDRSLSNIYSVSFSPNLDKRLVVAGGDKGMVCVFPKETQKETVEPLMSFNAHKGWISSVSLDFSQPGRNLLLTSANDAKIKLWDLNEYSEVTSTPKEIFQNQLHPSGIFSMHVQREYHLIATGSKDTTVVISKLREDHDHVQVVRRYEDNTGVVKQVQWRDTNCLGATGNDRCIRIYDTRSDATNASTCIEDAHTQAINSLRWHPTNEHFLMSSSFDTCLHLFDIRKPSEPYNTFNQHMVDRKYTRIYHPCFLQGGDVIATGTTGTKGIMLFNTMGGVVISSGYFNDINAIYPDPYDTKVLVTTGRSMLYLKPYYNKHRRTKGVDDEVDHYNGYLSPKESDSDDDYHNTLKHS